MLQRCTFLPKLSLTLTQSAEILGTDTDADVSHSARSVTIRPLGAAECRGCNLMGNARSKHVLVAVAGAVPWQVAKFHFIPTATGWKYYALDPARAGLRGVV